MLMLWETTNICVRQINNESFIAKVYLYQPPVLSWIWCTPPSSCFGISLNTLGCMPYECIFSGCSGHSQDSASEMPFFLTKRSLSFYIHTWPHMHGRWWIDEYADHHHRWGILLFYSLGDSCFISLHRLVASCQGKAIKPFGLPQSNASNKRPDLPLYLSSSLTHLHSTT